jgi:Putative beta barrel porin-7 (BBP7)
MIEQVSASGSTTLTVTPTKTIFLAGIPIVVNAGSPAGGGALPNTPVTGIAGPAPFASGAGTKTVFAVVPSGTVTVGYDITDVWSLTLAYNYIYLSSVGRVGNQVPSSADIRQSGFFAQGITIGAKAQF